MYKYLTIAVCIASAASLFAAPTANEDYVDRQDAQTYTNAVTDAATYTDAATNGAVTAARSLANAAKTGAVAQANAYTDAATNGAVAAANAYTDAAVADAKPSDYDTVKATAESAVQPADLEPYCTIEAARQMTNGIPVVTKATVTGWGFLESFTEADPTFAAWLATNPLDGLGTPDDYNTVKANASAGSTHAARTDNPHGVTAAQIGAFPAASGQTLQQAVQVISVHLNAEDARDIVTNYNSAVNMPSRRLEYKEPDGPNAGQFRVVWDELTRWNWLTGEYLPSNFYTKAEVDARTDHIQWGLFDSQTGNFSPEKTVQISSDRVILCKGASYQRTATASGTYFVWTSNEPYSITGVESNGYFRIEDAEGNVTFEIVKGDKVTAAATVGGVSTEQVMGITHLHIRYPIEADAHPTLEICNDLTTHDWKPETDPGCLANVTWSGVSGNYTAEVWGKSAEDQLFVKATYERGSDPYVRYAQAIALQTVKIGNTIYYVGTATISGHTVLTLSLTPQ